MNHQILLNFEYSHTNFIFFMIFRAFILLK